MENTDASGFVLLSDVIPDAILDIRYYTTFNFTGERVDGYEEPVALLTKKGAALTAKGIFPFFHLQNAAPVTDVEHCLVVR